MQEEITLNSRALNSILQRIEKQLEKSVAYINRFQFHPLKFYNRVKLKEPELSSDGKESKLSFSIHKSLKRHLKILHKGSKFLQFGLPFKEKDQLR